MSGRGGCADDARRHTVPAGDNAGMTRERAAEGGAVTASRAASAGEPHAHGARPTGRGAALLPPCFFTVAVAFFALALGEAPFVAGELQGYFYQAHVLALTHMLALGWISMAMVGVLYRYVPAISKRPLPYPRLAVVQGVTFLVGVVILVTNFWLGRWTPAAIAAGLLAVSAVLLCANLWPLLFGAPNRGVAEVGILLATAFLVAAATLGTLLALDKEHPFLGGSMLTNLGAHVHLAALGWVGVTICALSFRFLPAFLLPTFQAPDAARRRVLALAGAVVVLAIALLARSPLLALAATVVVAALVAYLALLVRVLATHRMPIDWTARHALAGAAWLLVAVAGGIFLAAMGAETATGARVAAAYGVAGILGWMSNLVIGISYKLFPGFVAAARVECRRRAVPVLELSVPPPFQAVVFALYNAGVVLTVGGLLADQTPVLMAGTAGLAAGAVLYATFTSRTLAFTLVDPPTPANALRILP